MDTTAFGLLLNNLLWKIGRLNWTNFCTLLATSRDKHLATMQRWSARRDLAWSTGRRPQFAGHAKFSASRRQFSRVTSILAEYL